MKNKKNLGFTLIELLIVIAIIGILASAILVGLSGAREKAKDTAVMSSVTSTVGAVLLCMDKKAALINNAGNASGGLICGTTGDTWPDLTVNDWNWTTRTADSTNGTFSLVATSAITGSTSKTITCGGTSGAKCQKTGSGW